MMLIDFPQQQCLHERASMLRYTYIARLAKFYLEKNLCDRIYILISNPKL